MPILDADLAGQVAQGEKTGPSRLKLVLGLALAALGLAAGLTFLLAPKQAQKTVREVVHAAQALVQKAPAAEATQDEDEAAAAPAEGRRWRRHARLDDKAPSHTVAAVRRAPVPDLHTSPPGVPTRRQLHGAELPIGTARREVREMFGDPDLELYKLEKEHEVEHFVYVNRAQNYATSVLLVDGRVASVYAGMPSVWSWP